MTIKEFLPNPIGRDQDGEYIKLLNDTDNAVSLSGWQIKDASEKTFKLSGSLEAGKELFLPSVQTKISLNNNGEKLFLYDAAGKLVDELGYTGQAKEGEVIKRLATSELVTSKSVMSELGNGELGSKNNFPQVFLIDFLTAAILAALGLYIILQLEKKLEIKLF